MIRVPAYLATSSVPARRVVTGVVPIAGLPPGDHVIRGVVLLDGKPVGQVTRTLRKARSSSFLEGACPRRTTALLQQGDILGDCRLPTIDS